MVLRFYSPLCQRVRTKERNGTVSCLFREKSCIRVSNYRCHARRRFDFPNDKEIRLDEKRTKERRRVNDRWKSYGKLFSSLSVGDVGLFVEFSSNVIPDYKLVTHVTR